MNENRITIKIIDKSLGLHKDNIDSYRKILDEARKKKQQPVVGITMFEELLNYCVNIAEELFIEERAIDELTKINQDNCNQIKKYFNTQCQDKIKLIESNFRYSTNGYHLIECKAINFNKQKQKKPEYKIDNKQSINIAEEKKPEYRINKTHKINIIAEKKCTEDKDIQTDKTDDVKLMTNAEVKVNIEDKPKKVVQKPKKKFNWNFNHFQSKDKFCSFERIGDIFGYRNPSNLMISSGKSPFRNYDKNKDVGLQPWKCGQNNNQGWRI